MLIHKQYESKVAVLNLGRWKRLVSQLGELTFRVPQRSFRLRNLVPIELSVHVRHLLDPELEEFISEGVPLTGGNEESMISVFHTENVIRC